MHTMMFQQFGEGTSMLHHRPRLLGPGTRRSCGSTPRCRWAPTKRRVRGMTTPFGGATMHSSVASRPRRCGHRHRGSWTPLRRSKVFFLPSGEMSQFSARSGMIVCAVFGSRRISVSSHRALQGRCWRRCRTVDVEVRRGGVDTVAERAALPGGRIDLERGVLREGQPGPPGGQHDAGAGRAHVLEERPSVDGTSAGGSRSGARSSHSPGRGSSLNGAVREHVRTIAEATRPGIARRTRRRGGCMPHGRRLPWRRRCEKGAVGGISQAQRTSACRSARSSSPTRCSSPPR